MEIQMKYWFFSLLFLSMSHTHALIEEINPVVLLKSRLNIKEPSALSLSADKQFLWSLSDNNGSLYSLDFNGKILNEVRTDLTDLEGVTAHEDLGGMCVTQERLRQIVCLDELGKTISKNAVNISGASNSGLEGITFNPDNQKFYLINEKDPTIILELDRDFNILTKKSISFAKDLSDIFYDEQEKKIWVLSHESQKAFRLDQNFQFDLIINLRGILQAEGLVIDSLNRKAYVVSDKDNLFYTLKY